MNAINRATRNELRKSRKALAQGRYAAAMTYCRRAASELQRLRPEGMREYPGNGSRQQRVWWLAYFATSEAIVGIVQSIPRGAT